MGATLATLRARCRLTLADATAFPDATLNAWLGDAIRFYSQEFPRTLRYTLTLTTGTQAYALPVGCLGVDLVEYPAGEDPPEYVCLVNEDHGDFANESDVYALRGPADSVGATTDTVNTYIVFAETVTTGETAVITYRGHHRVPTGDTEVTSVPEAHTEALIAFVEFRSQWKLEADEAVNLSDVSIILSQLGQEARLAWRRYKEIIERLQAQAPSPAGMVYWGKLGL
jgi:hypothetical protein